MDISTGWPSLISTHGYIHGYIHGYPYPRQPWKEMSTPCEHIFPTMQRFNRHFPILWICNVRGGTCTKLDEIAKIILVNRIDIAVLVETCLHGGIHDDLINIPGYTVYRKDRTDGRVGGGILVYSRNEIPCHFQPQLDHVDMEVVWLLYRHASMPREVSHILIGAIYHPPHAHNGRMLDHLISSMDTISRQHPYTGRVLLGDFNQLPDSR